MSFQMNVSGTFQEDLVFIYRIDLIAVFGYHFPTSWKEAKIITLPKPKKDPKFTSDQTLLH
jgi:hypothetical protein